MKEGNDYEKAAARLEIILKKIEDPSTKLSEIAGDVKEAKALIEKCKAILHETEADLEKSFDGTKEDSSEKNPAGKTDAFDNWDVPF